MQGLEAGEDGGAGQHLDEVAEQIQGRAGVGIVPDRIARARVSLGLEKEEKNTAEKTSHKSVM